ncbi:MAG: cyanobacterial phytochrome A, partial [Planctomycetia bacterium]
RLARLLEYSRLGKVNLLFAPTDLQEVLQETLEMTALVLEEARVEVRVPTPLPVVACDGARIAEVFHNLIGNAAKYNKTENE